MSDSMWPHRWQPTRLPCPCNSPGKNTGVGCHFLLQCMKVKSESEVQSCPTLSDPMDCSLPGYSIHGIFQARVLEWVVIAFSSWRRDHHNEKNSKIDKQANLRDKEQSVGQLWENFKVPNLYVIGVLRREERKKRKNIKK